MIVLTRIDPKFQWRAVSNMAAAWAARGDDVKGLTFWIASLSTDELRVEAWVSAAEGLVGKPIRLEFIEGPPVVIGMGMGSGKGN
jgi:hypothetical protein